MIFELNGREVRIKKILDNRELLSYQWTGSKLFSVIKRNREQRVGNHKGDNCPILYAMKKTDDLTVTDNTMEQIYSIAHNRISEYFSKSFNYEAIITMPSKHRIAYKLAKIISNIYNVPIYNNLFVKTTKEQALQSILDNKNLSAGTKQSLKIRLDNQISFSIKNIPTIHRKDIQILKWNNIGFEANRVLLVDDIFSSGATLEQAKALLQQYKNVEVDALTLFSPLKNPQK